MRTTYNRNWPGRLYCEPGHDDRVRPATKGEDVTHRHAEDRVGSQPGPVNGHQLAQICEAWLLLNHGSGYRLIRNPVHFRNRADSAARRNRFAAGEWGAGVDAGQYDLTEIEEPQLAGDRLRCYVEDRITGIPYRVELPWPVDAPELVRFELLAMVDEGGLDYI